MDYVEMTKQFMKCDDEKRKEVFLAFVKKYYYDDMVVLNRETLEKIMPIISTPDKDNKRFCQIFGIRYSLKYVYEDFAEKYCTEYVDYCEDDYAIKVRVYAEEEQTEYDEYEEYNEWTSVLFIREFWDFYSNYVNG